MAHLERFAPSPTGPLHLGHAFSALTAWERAQAAGGGFLLRLEDIDTARSRAEYIQAIYEDLHWLGLDWPTPVLRQSTRLPAYRNALQKLGKMGLTYACTCTRRDIANALGAPQEGAPLGPDGVIYPGTCKGQNRQGPAAIRLDMAKAVTGDITYFEGSTPVTTPRAEMIETIGDIVLARKDIGTSYHLSVVLDDAFQGITHVTRGADLRPATPIHALLQNLLGLPAPVYHHHRLIRDENGKRLAKRDDARAIAKYRAEGASPQDIRKMVGL